MRIGILGSGLMGGKLGTIFARVGHDVVFSYARTEQKLNRLAREANGNARAATPAQAAQNADAILLAVHWSRIDDALNQAGDLSGKVIVSCSLPMNRDDTELIIAHTWSGSEDLAKRLPKARIVSAFNTVPSDIARLDSGETELQASSGLRQAPFECSEEARCFTSGDGAMIESER
jgi:predicted dinucleotide-binding enzyme